MSEYASRIRKLQQEMGIQGTKFDDDILDEQDLNQIQQDTDKDEIQHNNVRVVPKMIYFVDTYLLKNVRQITMMSWISRLR